MRLRTKQSVIRELVQWGTLTPHECVGRNVWCLTGVGEVPGVRRESRPRGRRVESEIRVVRELGGLPLAIESRLDSGSRPEEGTHDPSE